MNWPNLDSPGAQKKTVLGPAAWFQSGMSFAGTSGVAVFTIKAYNLEAIFDYNLHGIDQMMC